MPCSIHPVTLPFSLPLPLPLPQSWGLRKLQALREPLKPALLKACKFVQRSEVNDALLYFNILEEDDLKQIREHDDYDDDQSIGAVGGKNHERVLKDKMVGLAGAKFNCIPFGKMEYISLVGGMVNLVTLVILSPSL